MGFSRWKCIEVSGHINLNPRRLEHAMNDAMWMTAAATIALGVFCLYVLVRIGIEETATQHANAARIKAEATIAQLTSAPIIRVMADYNPISGAEYFRPLNDEAFRHLPPRRKTWKAVELARLEADGMARIELV